MRKTVDEPAQAKAFHVVVGRYWQQIQTVYHEFSNKRPVIEIRLPARKIAAYSANEYSKRLNARSRKILIEAYRMAQAQNEALVFVKDSSRKTLCSGLVSINAVAEGGS